MQPVTTTIVAEPHFMYAALEGQTLVVYRSVLVHDDAKFMDPVRDLLNNREHRIVLAQVVEDDDMMFGEGLLSVYRFTS